MLFHKDPVPKFHQWKTSCLFDYLSWKRQNLWHKTEFNKKDRLHLNSFIRKFLPVALNTLYNQYYYHYQESTLKKMNSCSKLCCMLYNQLRWQLCTLMKYRSKMWKYEPPESEYRRTMDRSTLCCLNFKVQLYLSVVLQSECEIPFTLEDVRLCHLLWFYEVKSVGKINFIV